MPKETDKLFDNLIKKLKEKNIYILENATFVVRVWNKE